MREKTLVFFHIPKTAGTTISSIIRPLYSKEECYICSSDNRTHLQGNIDFANLDDEQKRKYKYISGHLELFLLHNIPQDYIAITFLRNPVERIISLYYFILKTETHHLHTRLNESNISLKEFVLGGFWEEVDNGMTRRLSGIGSLVPYGKCNNDMLILAKNNLLGFDFIGIQERFDEFLFLMSKILELKNILYTSKNVGHKSKKYHDIDKDTITVPLSTMINGTMLKPTVKVNFKQAFNDLKVKVIEYQKQQLTNQVTEQANDVVNDVLENVGIKTDSTNVLNDILNDTGIIKTDSTSNGTEDVIKDVLGGLFGGKKKKKKKK